MIVFENMGIIERAAIFTMGVNVKEGAQPIGHFGTGLKFAIATILRNGGKIRIFRGDWDTVDFYTKKEVVRGKEFDMVYAVTDGVTVKHESMVEHRALGFTTELGKNWEPWMAFRELACNALDERGTFYRPPAIVNSCLPEYTRITVQCEGIEQAFDLRDEILVSGEPIASNSRVEIRPGPSRFIYYRGVRIAELARPTRHSYNLLGNIALTEDRTAKSMWEVGYEVAHGLALCDDALLLDAALTCGKDWFEHHLDFPMDKSSQSEPFRQACARLRSDLSAGEAANPSALKIAFELRLAALGPDSAVALATHDAAKLDRAVNLLCAAGYNINDYPITIVEDLGPGRLGMAQEKRIFISRLAFDKGTKEVAATLLEEWAHLRTGHGDMTRGLQTWLFDQVLVQLEARMGQPF